MSLTAWMTRSKLKLNPGKAESRLIASTKNLDVVFDSSLNLEKDISQTCTSCFYHIHNLREILNILFLALATQITMVSSKLDYCNTFTKLLKTTSLDYTVFRTALLEW